MIYAGCIYNGVMIRAVTTHVVYNANIAPMARATAPAPNSIRPAAAPVYTGNVDELVELTLYAPVPVAFPYAEDTTTATLVA